PRGPGAPPVDGAISYWGASAVHTPRYKPRLREIRSSWALSPPGSTGVHAFPSRGRGGGVVVLNDAARFRAPVPFGRVAHPVIQRFSEGAQCIDPCHARACGSGEVGRNADVRSLRRPAVSPPPSLGLHPVRPWWTAGPGAAS